MPLSTFYNLAQERQEEIIHVAIDEFSYKDFKGASVSKIITQLGLAKGSFYRYFKDKKDLYIFLLEKILSERKSEIYNVTNNQNLDLFQILRVNLHNKVEFDMKHPSYSRFLNKFINEKNNQVIQGIYAEFRKTMNEIVEGVVRNAMRKNEIRDDLEIQLVVYLILEVQIGLFDLAEIRNEKGEIIGKNKNQILHLSDQLIELLKNGLSKKRFTEP